MATKRSRRANGARDSKGVARRRANGQGTLEKRGARWLARYYIVVDGQRVRKTKMLDATTVDGAREELAKLSDGGATFTQERVLERTIRDLGGLRAKAEAAEALRREADALTVADAWERFVASKKRPDSGERTLQGYHGQWLKFAAWLAENHPACVLVKDVTGGVAEEFLDVIERTRSRNTRAKYLVFLRMFWRVLRMDPSTGVVVDPWLGIRSLVQQPDTVRHRDLTVDELCRIGEVLAGDEIRARVAVSRDGEAVDLRGELAVLFAVGVFTGLRLSDSALLAWEQVDLARGIVDVTPRKTARRYGSRVTIPIHPTLAGILQAVPPDVRRGFVMREVASLYGREPSMLTRRVSAAFEAAGIETSVDAPSAGGGSKRRCVAGFHSLRHFNASWLENHGASRGTVDFLLCHSAGTVSARYFHENQDVLRRAVGTLPALPVLASACGVAVDDSAMIGNAPKTALENAEAVDAVIVQPDGADAAEVRFSAFREMWANMCEEERERVRRFVCGGVTA